MDINNKEVKGLRINGKEVKSISKNNEIIYELSNGGSVVQPTPSSVSLTIDKSILSYVDNETATLTATVLDSNDDPIENVTVTFYNDSTSMGTATTNASGVATKSYSSTGVGDVGFSAEVGSLTDTITVEDCWRYIQTPSDNQTFSVPTGNYKIMWNWKISSMTNATSAINDGSSNYIGLASTNGYIGFYNPNNFLPTTITADNITHNVELDYNNGTWTFKYNNESVSDSRTLNTSALKLRKMSNNSDSMTEFKIKPLHSIDLTASQSILSYADSDTTTFTATHSDGTGQTVNLYDASDDSLIGAMTDNNDGTYTYTYNSQGTGDLEVYAKSGSLESETYTIEDCQGYRESIVWTPTTTDAWYGLFDVGGDVEITATIKGTNKGFAIFYNQLNQAWGSNEVHVGVDGGNYLAVTSVNNNSSTNHTAQAFRQYQTNSELSISIERIGNTITIKNNDLSYTFTYTPSLQYIGIGNWNNANKTITVTNLKVKQL